VNGYILDSLSGNKIGEATVYDAKTLSSAITDQYGYFSFVFSTNVSSLDLMIRKKGYEDREIHIPRSRFQSLEIALKPLPFPAPAAPDSITQPAVANGKPTETPAVAEPKGPDKIKGVAFLLGDKIRTNTRNIADVIFKKVQFSLLPTIGTNKLIGGNVVNGYSINLLAGYSLGVNRMEIGLLNMDQRHVRYFQAGGFGNLVGGKVTGCQLGGFMNVDADTVNGFQAAGFCNVVGKSMSGCQLAGFLNLNRDTMKGFQAAGFSNINASYAHGAQLAGFSNHTLRIDGFQAAGGYNFVPGSMKGAQAAGMFNFTAGHFQGFQVAGLFNFATKVKSGLQLAPFNFADSSGGTAIGIFSFVRKGYHKIELSTDELFRTNIAFRTGLKNFHNLFSASIQPESLPSGQPVWALGYGLGTSFRIYKFLDMDADLSTHYINRGEMVFSPFFNKLYAGFDCHLSNNISIAFGPTLNCYFIDPSNPDVSNPLDDAKLSYFYDQKVWGDVRLKAWIGWKVGLRLL
jgi:hypothetical protein